MRPSRRTAGRTAVVIAGALAIAGAAAACKGKAADKGPAAGSGSAAAAPGSATGSGSAGGAAPGQNVLDVPPDSGKPPPKTTKPVGRPQLEAASKLDVEGWGKSVRVLKDDALEVRYKTKARPVLGVTISATRCFDCTPMELPKWQVQTEALKALLAPELRVRKDTLFELGETEHHGAKLIYSYQVGHVWGPDETGQHVGAYSDAYALYWNDGMNQMRVVAQYMDDPVATRGEMLALAPREDLEKIARRFFDAYVQGWAAP